MSERYQMVAANRGKVLGAAPSILALFNECGWEGEWRRWHDDVVVIRDTLKGTEMSKDQYAGIIRRLRGWEANER